MKRLPILLFISALTGILSLGTFWTTIAQADSKRHFTLEVGMDFNTGGVNVPDVDAYPGGGVPFRSLVGVFNGNIYPEGMLESGTELPDGKIGTWRCHFTGLNGVAQLSDQSDALDFPLTGAVTYYVQLNPTGYDPDESMIIVMGLNSHTRDDADNVPRVLAVVGGTGRFAGATGEVREEVIGRNTTPARNLRFTFWLRGVRGRYGHRHRHFDDDD